MPKAGVKIILPVDHVAPASFAADAKPESVDGCDIPDSLMGMDVGHKTIELYKAEILNAKVHRMEHARSACLNLKLSHGTEAVARL